MEPFTFLPAYNIAVCCGQGRVADEAAKHLRQKHKISKQRQEEIVRNIYDIPGIIRTQAELRQFRLPQAAIDAIPELEAPKRDGMKCHQCPHVARQVQKIQEHCRQVHGWRNDRRSGRPTKQQQRVGHQVPWTVGVCCQRFFKSRYASGWFEVKSGGDGQQGDEETDERRVRRIEKQKEAQFEAARRRGSGTSARRNRRICGCGGSGGPSIWKDWTARC